MDYIGKLKSIDKHLVTFETEDELDITKIFKHADRSSVTANIEFYDKDMLTDDQRKKTFALINDIAEYTGYPPDVMYEKMKFYYMAEIGCDPFSLSENGVTKKFASSFIEFIIEWCFQLEIPFKYREYHLAADESRTLFIYLKYRYCFVCGKPHSDIAHVESVGSGRNRNKIDHRKHHFMCLCRKHHAEQHAIGIESFMELHHLVPIKLNEETIILLGLMTRKQINELGG